MFIYVRTYSAAISGKVQKSVCCEKCGGYYAYAMVRRGFARSSSAYGIGNATAQTAAQRGAHKKLQKRLANDSDPVACPGCGWIQTRMVADLRRRAHEWLRWVAWIGLAIGLACGIMGILAASNGFARSPEPEQAGLIAAIIACTFGWLCAALGGRSLLARLIDPNRNYPERPGLIPGAPQAIKLAPGGLAIDVESSFPGPSQALAMESKAPASSYESSSRTLAYESKPLRVEPGGWVTVQLLSYRSPPRCSCCMDPTQSVRTYNCGRLAKVQLPLCEKCYDYYKGERIWINLVAGLGGAAVGMVAAFATGITDGSVIALTALTSAIGLLAGFYIAARRSVPAQFSRFSPALNTVRIRFRNPAFIHAVLEAGRVV